MQRKTFAALVLGASASLGAQPRMLRVTTPDGKPVAYASVTLPKEPSRITDENGIVSFGSLPATSVKIDVRRMGYSPFSGPLAVTDASILTIAIAPIKAQAGQFDVEAGGGPLSIEGFYKRYLKRQNASGTGVFFGPEDIDRRNSSDLAALVRDLNGVRAERATDGGFVATASGGGGCQMPIIADGQIVRLPSEAGTPKTNALPEEKIKSMSAEENARMGIETPMGTAFQKRAAGFADSNSVKVDQVAPMPSVFAVEVYTRGTNLPAEFLKADKSCGLIVIWTGSRK